MRVDGKKIAEDIFENLRKKIKDLRKKNIIPHVAIILIGDNPASKSYIRQKELKAKAIGTNVTIYNLKSKIKNSELINLIKKLNNNKNVHGIIVQRPMPDHIDVEAISLATNPQKDIDSFHPKSPYQMPLAQAVLKILEEVFKRSHLVQGGTFTHWLKSKKIVVMGKGQTAGEPTIKMLKQLGVQVMIVDSKTEKPEKLTKKADIIISTVGKSKILRPEMIKKNVILISVGLHKGGDGKLHGDYEEEEIKNLASFYTPTPKGVGPVNVACILENLIKASENFAKKA